jgi:hypothetical protein
VRVCKKNKKCLVSLIKFGRTLDGRKKPTEERNSVKMLLEFMGLLLFKSTSLQGSEVEESAVPDSTLEYYLSKIDIVAFNQYLKNQVYRYKRDKRLGNLNTGGKTILCMDGTGIFSSNKLKDNEVLTAKSGDGTIRYSKKVLICALVNKRTNFCQIIHVEPIRNSDIINDKNAKQDCEQAAARRALAAIDKCKFKLYDVVCADGLYATAPFIIELHERKIDVVINFPHENRDLAKVASSRFGNASVQPLVSVSEWIENKTHKIQYYTCAEDLSKFWKEIEKYNEKHSDNPIPIYAFKRITTKPQIKGRQTDVCTSNFISTIKPSEENKNLINTIQKSRWVIENNIINIIKNKYNLKHCYTMRGVFAVWLFAASLYNMFMIFLHKYYKGPKRTLGTIAKICKMLFKQNNEQYSLIWISTFIMDA